MTGERYVRRFSRTERAVHWVHASAFLVLLGSGLVLYLPSLATEIGRRPLVKDVHLFTALAWAIALLAVVALGDRRGLRDTTRELDVFDADDRRWLRGGGVPQGRFNAGQKLNARLSALGLAVLYATGLALLLAGRGLPQGPLHTLTTVAVCGLLSGHVFMAVLNPATRHALRGMTFGDVDRNWAKHHHPLWVAAVDREATVRRSDLEVDDGP